VAPLRRAARAVAVGCVTGEVDDSSVVLVKTGQSGSALLLKSTRKVPCAHNRHRRAAAHQEAAPLAAGITPSLPATISCGSTKECLAVGSSYTMIGAPSGPTITRTKALAWNGSTWRSISVPVPKGAKGAELG
jgi:hypothetical protein